MNASLEINIPTARLAAGRSARGLGSPGQLNARIAGAAARGSVWAAGLLALAGLARATDLTDAFNRANNTTSLGNTAVGHPWTAAKGVWGINSNRAYTVSGSSGDQFAVVNSLANGFVQAKITTLGSWVGLVFRYQDTSNYWKVSADLGNNRWTVARVVGGTQGGYQYINQAPAAGNTVKVSTSGSTITVFINGVQKAQFTDSALQSATKTGLLGHSSGLAARFDDFATTGPWGTRVAFQWPFSSDSPWNTPIGSGAVYVQDNTIQLGGTNINYNQFTTAVYKASSGDPTVAVSYDGGCFGIADNGVAINTKIPVGADALPPLTCTTDRRFVIVETDGETAHEFYNFWRRSNTTADAAIRRTNALNNVLTGGGIGSGSYCTGDQVLAGTRAYGGASMAGLMRKQELESGGTQRMKHALAVSLGFHHQRDGNGSKCNTFKWPAVTSDGGWASYTGTIYMGELLAIPKSVNINNLGLTADGLALAWTMQNFGVYNTDSNGANGSFVLNAETGTNATIIDNMKADLDTLRDLLQKVTNNDATHVGGGGTYPVALYPAPDPVP
jgi:hypothetical protein